jgi:DNA-directed RNA polymerase alpha subunit
MSYYDKISASSEQLDLKLKNIDVSLVNGLRRVLLAEVETASINGESNVTEETNVTIFNTEYLKDRLSMIPLYLENQQAIIELKRLIKENRLVFRLAVDDGEYDKKIVNTSNDELNITCHHVITLFKDGDTYTKFDINFFKYDLYLLTLKKGESIWMEMYPSFGLGKTHARWQSGVVTYNFENDEKDIYQSFKNYERDQSPYGKYGSPKIFNLTVEANGHYDPAFSWVMALDSLYSKIDDFREELFKIEKEESYTVSDKLRIEFSSDVENLITLYVSDEDHTLGNIIMSHYLYNLDKKLNDTELLNSFSHYRIPTLLDPNGNKLVMMFKAPSGIDISLDLAYGIFQTNVTLKLLAITVIDVLSIITGLKQEFKP